jgi:hypothetical protein
MAAYFRGELTDLDYAEERVRASMARVPVSPASARSAAASGGIHG